MRSRVLAVALGVLLTVVPGSLFAQTSGQFEPFVFGTNLSLSLSPRYPAPGQQVRVSLNGLGVDLSGSSITWRVDGKLLTSNTDVSTDVVAPALGAETVVEASVTTPDGIAYSAQAVIAPTELDLLVDADSYVPPFFRGRAKPSAGTSLIVEAAARFKRTDGTLIPDRDITYTWKRGNEVLGSLSGRGKSGARIPVVHLFTTDTIRVTAVSNDGTRAAEAAVTVPSVEPKLNLYQDHPLYGILYNNALPALATTPESEMTFAAVPYFAQVASPNDPFLSYVWRVNDVAVPASRSTPNTLTINADNSSGQATVSLEVAHSSNAYMDARGEWFINFSRGGGPVDAFHAAQ